MTGLYVTMALAGFYGFCLSLYFFRYRTNLVTTWQLLGGVFGGLILGGCLAVFTFVMMWPPVEIWFTTLGILIIAIISAVILVGGREKKFVKKTITW